MKLPFWLVVWNIFSHILGIIIPIDELIFFRGVAQPPASQGNLSGTLHGFEGQGLQIDPTDGYAHHCTGMKWMHFIATHPNLNIFLICLELEFLCWCCCPCPEFKVNSRSSRNWHGNWKALARVNSKYVQFFSVFLAILSMFASLSHPLPLSKGSLPSQFDGVSDRISSGASASASRATRKARKAT